jgi:hypothetical protein
MKTIVFWSWISAMFLITAWQIWLTRRQRKRRGDKYHNFFG